MSFDNQAFPLGLRVYRDAGACPVPVARAGADALRLRFVDARPLSAPGAWGNVARVEEYERATALYTGTTHYRDERLATDLLAREPVLLDLRAGASASNGGFYRRLARPLAYEGEGRNPYTAARLVPGTGPDAPDYLFTPGLVGGAGHTAGRAFTARARSLGRGVFLVPAGYAVDAVEVGGAAWDGLVDHDPYHGALYLQADGSSKTATADADVEVTLSGSGAWLHALPEATREPGAHGVVHRRGTLTIGDDEIALTRPTTTRRSMEAIAGEASGAGAAPYARDYVLGYVVAETDPAWADARRLPAPVEDGLRYHRVGTGYYDASPVATSRLWIVETDAPADRLRSAVDRTLPAGSLYRTVPATG